MCRASNGVAVTKGVLAHLVNADDFATGGLGATHHISARDGEMTLRFFSLYQDIIINTPSLVGITSQVNIHTQADRSRRHNRHVGLITSRVLGTPAYRNVERTQIASSMLRSESPSADAHERGEITLLVTAEDLSREGVSTTIVRANSGESPDDRRPACLINHQAVFLP